MSKSLRKFFLVFAFLPFLSSCGLDDFIVRERDFSKLYLGGYPSVSYSDSVDTDDYWLYVSMCTVGTVFDSRADFVNDTSDSGEVKSFAPKFDFSVNLNSSSCVEYSVADGLMFFDFGSYFSLHNVGSSLSDWFDEGNYLSVFSSVGEYKAGMDNPKCSCRCRVGASGEFVAFDTCAVNGGVLSCKVSYCYHEIFKLGGVSK
jgi:hypothetical protein